MPRNSGQGNQKARTESAPELEEILRKIREARNFDFRNYKRATLARRIERRMQDRGKRTLTAGGRNYTDARRTSSSTEVCMRAVTRLVGPRYQTADWC